MTSEDLNGDLSSAESQVKAHISKGQSVSGFFFFKFAVVGSMLPFVVDRNHRAVVQMSLFFF